MDETMKRLEDMSLQELWELFPIVLSPHKCEWIDLAKEEMQVLGEIISRFSPILNHIGSTAIPGIQAKPIADILIEVPIDCAFADIRNILIASGYICMSESQTRMSFNKGYTPEGYADKVFHIHVHRVGDNDEILFRDYLISHPKTAKEYESLKISLLPKYQNNRDAYTEAKSDFVKRTTERAKNKIYKSICCPSPSSFLIID